MRKLRIAGRPEHFRGNIRLPPSKSYVHRALFVASLGRSPSTLTFCGNNLSDDVLATIGALRAFGTKITHRPDGSLNVVPGTTSKPTISVFAKASGTTARFAIAYAALAKEGTKVKISGDDSLSRRPMESIFDSLAQLGVKASYNGEQGRLPIIIEGGGIRGGECAIDGSISSQFISSLLISCVRAKSDTTIRIKDPSKLVSQPYIDATLSVIRFFGLREKPKYNENREYAAFEIKKDQFPKSSKFPVPGDMSTAAALIGATLAARGNVKLLGVNRKLPQSDAMMVPIAKKFGAKIKGTNTSLEIKSAVNRNLASLEFDLNDSPDIVPVVAALAAAQGRTVNIFNVGHLRFKESDRISVLSRELQKLGVRTAESESTLSIQREIEPPRKPIVVDPEKDHRMLMALAIAGLSGRYGEMSIRDPDCVKKSYPDFVKDLQALCGEKRTVRIEEVREI